MEHYRYIVDDLNDACRYLNPESSFLPEEIKKILPEWIDVSPNTEHMALASQIEEAIGACQIESLQDMIIRAGAVRKFLG